MLQAAIIKALSRGVDIEFKNHQNGRLVVITARYNGYKSVRHVPAISLSQRRLPEHILADYVQGMTLELTVETGNPNSHLAERVKFKPYNQRQHRQKAEGIFLDEDEE